MRNFSAGLTRANTCARCAAAASEITKRAKQRVARPTRFERVASTFGGQVLFQAQEILGLFLWLIRRPDLDGRLTHAGRPFC